MVKTSLEAEQREPSLRSFYLVFTDFLLWRAYAWPYSDEVKWAWRRTMSNSDGAHAVGSLSGGGHHLITGKSPRDTRSNRPPWQEMRVGALETLGLGVLLVVLYMGLVWFMHLLNNL